mmetsp:Transcript_5188/g.7813  ORF Transcript_5188/g.7813 Transcript_5188/m.7813 type:complete len:287 (-) Transcript_5188:271-1131(-)
MQQVLVIKGLFVFLVVSMPAQPQQAADLVPPFLARQTPLETIFQRMLLHFLSISHRPLWQQSTSNPVVVTQNLACRFHTLIVLFGKVMQQQLQILDRIFSPHKDGQGTRGQTRVLVQHALRGQNGHFHDCRRRGMFQRLQQDVTLFFDQHLAPRRIRQQDKPHFGPNVFLPFLPLRLFPTPGNPPVSPNIPRITLRFRLIHSIFILQRLGTFHGHHQRRQSIVIYMLHILKIRPNQSIDHGYIPIVQHRQMQGQPPILIRQLRRPPLAKDHPDDVSIRSQQLHRRV